MSYLNIIDRHRSNQSEPAIAVSLTTSLRCNSSSEARPALTRQQIILRIARAVYFCREHGLEPTSYKLAKLTGLRKNRILEYNSETKQIDKMYKMSLVTYFPTAYTGIWRSHFGNFIPTSFQYSEYEVLNGLNNYRLDPLSTFVEQDSTLKTNTPSGSMAMLAAQLLKEYGLIHPLTSFSKAVITSASTIKLLWATTLQDGRVYHNSHALKTLLAVDANLRIVHRSEDRKCDGLFYRKDNTGNIATGSYKYVLSRRGETFMKVLVDRYLSLVPGDSKIDIAPSDMLIGYDEMTSVELSVRDQIVLLSRCAGMRDGKYHIVNTITDKQDSRVYGLMTMLTKRARTTLGYKEYDIAAALQSIVFDILDAKAPYNAEERFPLHYQMVSNRRAFREQIAREIGKDIAWVKTALTKIDNGGSVHYKTLEKSESLMRYKDEFSFFVEEFMKYSDPKSIAIAKRHAKVYDVENEFVNKLIGTKYREDGRKIYGLFFFVWTQTERFIREIMKKQFKGYCHDVHDAIATKEDVDISAINTAIAEAGFNYVHVE